MLKRARYIHWKIPGFYLPLDHAKGFSAEIAPMDDGINDKHCYFRITVCSSKDQFSRAKARESLENKPWQEVRVVDVPKMLSVTEHFCRDGKNIDRGQWFHNQWAWVYKYFL